MTLLPVVERELRVASRRTAVYGWRTGVALAAGFVGMFAARDVHTASGQVNGVAIFWFLGGLSLLYSAFAGTIFAADTISKERQNGTLGLLFLTDLTVWDIALGKLASCSLAAFLGLLAMQPIMCMALLLGGVTGGEYFRMCLILIVTCATSLLLGLFASTCSASSRISAVIALSLSLLLAGLFPLTGSLLQWLFARSLWWPAASVNVEIVYQLSPLAAFDGCEKASPRFWVSLLFTASAGFAALGAAIWRLPRIWQETGERQSRCAKTRRFGSIRAAAKRNQLLDQNPIAWLSVGAKPYRIIPFLIASFSFIAAGETLRSHWAKSMFGNYSLLSSDLASWPLGIGSFFFQVWVADEAGRQLSEDRRTGALELQLSSPLTVEEIIKGHGLSTWKLVRWPAAILLVSQILAAMPTPAGCILIMGGNKQAIIQGVFGEIAGIIVFCVNTWAIAMMSLDGALTLRSGRFASQALFFVLFFPWLGKLFVEGSALRLSWSPASSSSWYWLLAYTLAPHAISLLNALWWGITVRTHLPRSFRALAAAPAGSASRFWRIARSRKAQPPASLPIPP